MANHTKENSSFGTAAYGGDNWSQRVLTHQQELGSIWHNSAIDSEWRPLKSVLLHCPGDELLAAEDDPDAVQMLASLDLAKARDEHLAMTACYESLGIEVHHVMPEQPCLPNQMFCADLFVMTPQGAIIARPASTVRAQEERWVARVLANLGVPILRTLTGTATFEGADMMWLDNKTAMIGRGHRTNDAAIRQIEQTLNEIGCELICVDMPFGTMHFMGMLRIIDKDLAICWPRRTAHSTIKALQERGYEVLFPPFVDDQASYRGINFVTLGPRKVLMVKDLPITQSFLEAQGVECIVTSTDELSKAAGNVGCLTGVLARECA
jgi:N-dimethylarginine dimethylaminohydrolase